MTLLFWLIMALTFAWYMWDGGLEAISEWRWLRQARKEIKMMEADNEWSPR